MLNGRIRNAIAVTLLVFLLPIVIGFIAKGVHGATYGIGIGVAAAVLLTMVGYKRGRIGGDVDLPPGVFLRCECYGAAIKKLLPNMGEICTTALEEAWSALIAIAGSIIAYSPTKNSLD